MTMFAKHAIAAIALLALAHSARAGGVEEKKKRDAIDEAAAKAAADIKDCGKKFKVVFDWKAYDAIDWKTIGRDKVDYYANELNNLTHLGEGLNKLCADKDFKAAFVKVGTITYRSTNDTSISVKAVVAGGAMTISNYTFGSTRGARDYEDAAKAAL